MTVIKLLFVTLPRVIAGFRQRAIKSLPVCSVSLEDLVSDDPPPPHPKLDFFFLFFLQKNLIWKQATVDFVSACLKNAQMSKTFCFSEVRVNRRFISAAKRAVKKKGAF